MTFIPATEKQTNYIKLLSRLTGKEPVNTTFMTKDAASEHISWLLKQPKVQVSAPTPQVGEGLFMKDGATYVVAMRPSTKKLVCRRLMVQKLYNGKMRARFFYAGSMLHKLTEADRVSLEEAKAKSQMFGFCVMCGRTLKAQESVERLIGPVCIKRIGGHFHTKEEVVACQKQEVLL